MGGMWGTGLLINDKGDSQDKRKENGHGSDMFEEVCSI